jgi:hypothetical protein
MVTWNSTSWWKRTGNDRSLTASIGGETAWRLNAFRYHDKLQSPTHAIISGTPEKKLKQYYRGHKPWCMCGEVHKDWSRIITCKSLYASLHRTELWTKVKTSLWVWNIHSDFWIAIEKGIRHYAAHLLKWEKEDIPHEPPKTFGTTFHTQHNLLQVAFRKQSHVGWENFLIGRHFLISWSPSAWLVVDPNKYWAYLQAKHTTYTVENKCFELCVLIF